MHNIGCALEFQNEIDHFIGLNHDLRSLELDEDEWVAIASVAEWLMAFHSATTQMSMSRVSMLSTTHAIFRGLQEHVRKIYCDLPTGTAPKIMDGLLNLHKKLSDYYYKYNQSPFYIWATCNWPRGESPLVSTGTGHYDVCFVLPPISLCTISLGAAACSLTHSLSPYHCPIFCSLYYIGMTCGGPCLAPNY